MFYAESRLLLLVRPNDLDALGHVNNAVAVEYLEAGRWDWLARQNLVHSGRIVAVVARIEIDYRAEIPRGEIEVHTLLDLPTAEEFDEDNLTFRARFRQRLHLPGVVRPAAKALVTVAFLDTQNRCLATMQDFVAAASRTDSTTVSRAGMETP
jgi:acyl-CoA thioester hydrolase